MTKLEATKAKIKETTSIRKLAKKLGVYPADLSNYLNNKRLSLGKPAKKRIEAGLINEGILPEPKPIEYTVCPECGCKRRVKSVK